MRVPGCVDRVVVDSGGADIGNLFRAAILCSCGADVHLFVPS